MLRGERNGKYPDGNSMLVRGSEGVVLIDPSLTVRNRAGLGEQIDRVLISHAHEDHLAGLNSVTTAHVHAHEADLVGVHSLDGIMEVYGISDVAGADQWRAELVEQFQIVGWPDATGFVDGTVWDLGGVTVTALHLPGHTRGHTAFIVEPDGVAFVGDVDLSSFGPYYGDHWSDLDEFARSIERVSHVDARHYVTFHHKGVVDGRAAFVQALDAFGAVIDQRDERLVELLRAGVDTLPALVDAGLIYRPGTTPGGFGTSVEQRSIGMHLDRLARSGAVVRHPDGRWSVT